MTNPDLKFEILAFGGDRGSTLTDCVY